MWDSPGCDLVEDVLRPTSLLLFFYFLLGPATGYGTLGLGRGRGGASTVGDEAGVEGWGEVDDEDLPSYQSTWNGVYPLWKILRTDNAAPR